MKSSKAAGTVAWTLGLVCLLMARVSYAQECTDDGTYELCAEWSQPTGPFLNTHFAVNYTAGIPKVTLLSGDSGWRLYSQELASPSTPAAIGEITLDPNIATDNFALSIEKIIQVEGEDVAVSGASSVGDINLIDSVGGGATWTGSSSLNGAIITGSVTGDIKVVENDSGGGDIIGIFAIGGDYTGTSIIIPTVKGNVLVSGNVTNNANIQITTIDTTSSLHIIGDLAGDISVNTIKGTLTVGGKTDSPDDIVTIENMMAGAAVSLLNVWWHGKVDLKNGIPASTSVHIGYFAGELLLNNNPVEGTLSIGSADHKTRINPDDQGGGGPGTNGYVANGGVVNWGSLSNTCFGYVRGEARFHSVAQGGKIIGVDQMEGRIHIEGDMKGTITLHTLEPYDEGDCLVECGPPVVNHNCVEDCVDGGVPFPCEGEIIIGGDVIPDPGDPTAGRIEIHQDTKVGSSIAVTGEVEGVIELRENCRATITVTSDVSGSIEITDDLNADMVISGDLSGTLDVGDDLLSKVDVGSISGLLDVGDLLGRTAEVHVAGAFSSTGDIKITGECNGLITLDTSTASGSLIHLARGLSSTGAVTVNNDEGNYDAGGTITVGSLSGNPVGGNYDGSITIKDNSASGCAGSYGDLDGVIRIAVCDGEADDHEVCVEGDVNGSISVVDTTCAQQAPSAVCIGCE